MFLVSKHTKNMPHEPQIPLSHDKKKKKTPLFEEN